jgi:hypothetical protein
MRKSELATILLATLVVLLMRPTRVHAVPADVVWTLSSTTGAELLEIVPGDTAFVPNTGNPGIPISVNTTAPIKFVMHNFGPAIAMLESSPIALSDGPAGSLVDIVFDGEESVDDYISEPSSGDHGVSLHIFAGGIDFSFLPLIPGPGDPPHQLRPFSLSASVPRGGEVSCAVRIEHADHGLVTQISRPNCAETVVPEPSSALLLITGGTVMALIGVLNKRRKGTYQRPADLQ